MTKSQTTLPRTTLLSSHLSSTTILSSLSYPCFTSPLLDSLHPASTLFIFLICLLFEMICNVIYLCMDMMKVFFPRMIDFDSISASCSKPGRRGLSDPLYTIRKRIQHTPKILHQPHHLTRPHFHSL